MRRKIWQNIKNESSADSGTHFSKTSLGLTWLKTKAKEKYRFTISHQKF